MLLFYGGDTGSTPVRDARIRSTYEFHSSAFYISVLLSLFFFIDIPFTVFDKELFAKVACDEARFKLEYRPANILIGDNAVVEG